MSRAEVRRSSFHLAGSLLLHISTFAEYPPTRAVVVHVCTKNRLMTKSSLALQWWKVMHVRCIHGVQSSSAASYVVVCTGTPPSWPVAAICTCWMRRLSRVYLFH